MIETVPAWFRAVLSHAVAVWIVLLLVKSGYLSGFSLPAGFVAAIEGLIAMSFGRGFGLPYWWLPIQALFAPAAVLAWRLDFPPSLYLGGFVLLWLVFRSNFRERVPLYLTRRETWLAVAELLPRHNAFEFIDLGCGWGGGLAVLSEQRPSGEFLGVESAPLPVLLGRFRLRHERKCRIRFGNFWDEDLGRFDVVYAFLSPAPMPRLWRKARKEMKPGSLFISSTFEVPGVEPDRTLTLRDGCATRLLVWRM
ncbi:class I SAM-dependent methyltransferase [Methylocaldum sp. MU1018]